MPQFDRSTPLCDIQSLSVGTVNALYAEGFILLGDVQKHTQTELLSMRRMDMRKVDDLRCTLRNNGLYLVDETPETWTL